MSDKLGAAVEAGEHGRASGDASADVESREASLNEPLRFVDIMYLAMQQAETSSLPGPLAR